MFIKPFRVKSHSQMKGSDKKKFKAQIKTQFCIPECDAADLDSLLPVKEEATLSKIYTYGGESVIVYSVGKDPLFFEIDKQKTLYPTVYTLWKCPKLLGRKYMSTIAGVIPKISNGADLMLPGVVADVENRGMKAYCDGKLKKGDVLYINLVENRAAVAIGTACQASEDLYLQGMRGKAVNVLHCVGDQLWMTGNQTEPPNLGATEELESLSRQQGTDKSSDNDNCDIPSLDSFRLASEAYAAKKTELNALESKSESIDLNAESTELPSIENAVSNLLLSPVNREEILTAKLNEELLEDTNNENTSECSEELNVTISDEENGCIDQQDPELEIDTRSTEEIMNEMIENAFLQALKTTAKKLELPVLTSTFYRQHMVPACPIEIGGPIDLKKSSFKKLSKFLQKMTEEKIISIKEQKKGVEVISDVKYDHEKLLRFRPTKFDNAEVKNQEKEASGHYEPPIVTELYLVTAQVSNFFSKCGNKKGDGLTATEVRECIRTYVNKEKLQHPSDPTIINLDPVIAEVVLVKGENLVVTFRWDKLTSRVTSKMSKGYSMEFKSGNKTRSVVQKGKLEPVEMMLGTRSGNKKVTLIHNLDLYGIDMHEFAHKCQVGVAASTTIHEASNKKRAGGNPVMEVLVQGNQVAFASKLLIEEYKLPRKFIRGTELAAKKKGATNKK